MARIRTIKPDFFRHGKLFDAEMEEGLPLRVAFAGLWTACDREGRFSWRPRELKLDCLPFDDVDFSRVLDALRTRGHIVKFVVDGCEYGFIPSWNDHQVINNRESPSVIPQPSETSIAAATWTREPRVDDASTTRLVQVQGEGKGREGKGKEVPATTAVDGAVPEKAAKVPGRTTATWKSYAEAYRMRYSIEPLNNRTVNGQLAQFVARIPAEEAPQVAAFFVSHNGNLYVAAMHPVNLLLRDAEKLRTEWATGRTAAASQQSFSERDLEAKRARVREMTGGILGGSAGNVIDMEASDGAFLALG